MITTNKKQDFHGKAFMRRIADGHAKQSFRMNFTESETKPRVLVGGRDRATGFKLVPNVNFSFDCQSDIYDELYWFNINRRDVIIKNPTNALYQNDVLVVDDGNGISKNVWRVDDEGNFKWDIDIARKPESNVLQFELKAHPGLSFHYQPDVRKLARKYRDIGDLFKANFFGNSQQEPKNRGSYAVFCDKQGNHKSGGKVIAKYFAGQIAAIYRPLCIDAEGNKSWGEVNISDCVEGKKSNTFSLKITIPEDFLEYAVYPIKIDPYIGPTTNNGSAYAGPYIWGWTNGISAATQDGVITEVFGWCDTANKLRVGLYDNTGMSNTANLVAGGLCSVSYGSNLYGTGDISGQNGQIVNGNNYYPFLMCASGGSFYYVMIAPNAGYTNSFTWSAQPAATLSGLSVLGSHAYCYAEYDTPPAYGSLQIAIQPTSAQTNGRWRRTGTTTWYSHNDTETDIDVGTYEIEFLDIDGHNTPANITGVVISDGATTNETGTYVQLGTLQVNIQPTAAQANGQWRRVGQTTWLSHGATEELVPGTFEVEFNDSVTGYSPPNNITGISVTAGNTTQETGTYNEKPTVTITTPATDPYSTENNQETVSGSAADGDGTVSSVAYSTDRGHSGGCTGTTAWTADIPIEVGTNVITITATDDQGDTGTDQITITRGALTGWTIDDVAGTAECGGLPDAYFEQAEVDFNADLVNGNEYIFVVEVTAYNYGDLRLTGICADTAIGINGTGIFLKKVTCNSPSSALRIISDAVAGFNGTVTYCDMWEYNG